MSSGLTVRVVLVDDHPVFRLALRELVTSQPDLVVVGEVGTAEDGLRVVAETRPHVAVLDLSLPAQSGLALLPKLAGASPTTRVLILTAHHVDEYAGDAIRAGASGFATKGEEPMQVLRAIRAVARGDIFVSSIDSIELADRTPDSVVMAGYRRLTRREREVFTLSVCGLSNAETGARLKIALKTVETHRASVNRKIGVHSSADLARFAVRTGMTRRSSI